MLICHCSLPSTNPDACKSCSRYIEDQNQTNFQKRMESYQPQDTTQPQELSTNRNIKRITKTINKYDKKGKYKGQKIIVIEEELFTREVFSTEKYYENIYTVSGNSDHLDGSSSVSNFNTVSSTNEVKI